MAWAGILEGFFLKAWSRLNIAWFSFITQDLSGTVGLLKLIKD